MPSDKRPRKSKRNTKKGYVLAVPIAPREVIEFVRSYQADRQKILNCDLKRVVAAIGILTRYFGGDWPTDRLLKVTGRDGTFIHPPIVNPQDNFKRQQRIGDLAEHLVNLQGIPGFEWCLREVSRDSLETGLAKLIPAGMMRRRNIPFRFVVPSQQQGKDYDAEAEIGAIMVPIEMKAKIEGTGPTPEGIADRLKVARRQLPRDTPNLVFLRVPESWGNTAEGFDAISKGVLKELQDSGTIGVVAVHWDVWTASPTPEAPGGMVRHDRYLVLASGTARVGLDGLEAALRSEPDDKMYPWLSLHRLLCA
jgi:hypothetical protein